MFETKDFEQRLTAAISTEASRSGLARYQRQQIVEYLQRLAVRNERVLMAEELSKSAGQRRGIDEAIQSAVVLAKEASRYASAENRETLRLSDIEAAYEAKFCQVWPFCK